MSRESDAIIGIIDAISKKKNFKQLVKYNAQLLAKAVAPTKDRGWERKARIAYDAGAAPLAAELLSKYADSAEVFHASISALNAMASLKGPMDGMLRDNTASVVAQALEAAVTAQASSGSLQGDSVDAMTAGFEFLRRGAAHDMDAFCATGGGVAALRCAAQLAAASFSKSSHQARMQVVLSAMDVVDVLSRSRSSAAVLSSQPALVSFVSLLQTPLAREAGTAAASEVSSFQGRVGQASASGAAAREQHIAIALRSLDRITRTAQGLTAVQGNADMKRALSQAMALVADHTPAVALAVTLMGRLLGGDLTTLLQEVADSAAVPASRELPARILSLLLRDDEYAYAAAGQGAGEHSVAAQLMSALYLEDQTAATQAYLCASIAEVGLQSKAIRAALVAAGGIGLALFVLQGQADHALAVAEAAGLLAVILDSSSIVSALLGHSEYNARDVIHAALQQHASCSDGGDAAGALFHSLDSLLTFADLEDAAEQAALQAWMVHSILPLVPGAVLAAPNNLAMHLMAHHVMAAACSTEDAAEALCDAGVLQAVIADLKIKRYPAEATKSSQRPQELPLARLLVIASMYVLGSVCTWEEGGTRARAAGCIRAVLAGFSRFAYDSMVYNSFREVILVLNISEEEVWEAVHRVNFWTGVIVPKMRKADIFAPAKAVLAVCGELSVTSMPSAELPSSTDSMAITDMAERVLEAAALLEAVSVSPRLANALIAADGVHTLLYSLATLAVLPVLGTSSDSGWQQRAASTKRSATGQGIEREVQMEVVVSLMRGITQLTRLAYEVSSGAGAAALEAAELDDWRGDQLDTLLHSSLTASTVCAALTACVKLDTAVLCSLTLLSWLCASTTFSQLQTSVEALVAGGAVESTVMALRGHQSHRSVPAEAAGTLARLAATPHGASAVTTRGATRQVIRMLQPVARAHTAASDELLIALLRVLESCAHGDQGTAQLLRKQGIVDGLCACNSSKALDLLLAEDPAAILATGYTRPAATSAEIAEVIASILAVILSTEDVHAAVATLEQLAAEAADCSRGYTAGAVLRMPSFAPGVIVSALQRYTLLTKSEAAKQAGFDAVLRGVRAASTLYNVGMSVSQLDSDAGDVPAPDSLRAEMPVVVVAALLALQSGAAASTALASGADGDAALADAAEDLVQPLLQALISDPSAAASCLGALQMVSKNASAASKVAEVEGAIPALLSAMTLAAQRADDSTVGATCLTMSHVAAASDSARRALVDANAHISTLSMLLDMLADGSPATQLAGLMLIRQLLPEPGVPQALISGGIVQLLRGLLNAHCSNAQRTSPQILQGVAAVLASLMGMPDIAAANANALELRGTLCRAVRAAAAGGAAYTDAPDVMLPLVTAVACATDKSALPEAVADVNVNSLLAASADEVVISAISASSATGALVSVGQRALVSLGLSRRFKAMLDELVERTAECRRWQQAGWNFDYEELVAQVHGVKDVLRNLSALVAGSFGGADEGEVVATSMEDAVRTVQSVMSEVQPSSIAQAVSAVVDLMHDLQATPPSSSASASAWVLRADVLALALQAQSRLFLLLLAATEAMPELAGAISSSTVIANVASVLRMGVCEPSTLQAVDRALQNAIASDFDTAMQTVVEERAIPTLSRLLRLLRVAIRKVKLTGNTGLPGLLHLSETQLKSSIAALSSSASYVSRCMAPCLHMPQMSTDAAADVLLAAAVSDNVGSALAVSDGALADAVAGVGEDCDWHWAIADKLGCTVRAVAARQDGAFAEDVFLQGMSVQDCSKADSLDAALADGAHDRARVLHALARAAAVQHIGDGLLARRGDLAGTPPVYMEPHHVTSAVRALHIAANIVYGLERHSNQARAANDARSTLRGKARFRAAVRKVIFVMRFGNVSQLLRGGAARHGDAQQRAQAQLAQAHAAGLRNAVLRMLAWTDVDALGEEGNALVASEEALADLNEMLVAPPDAHVAATPVTGEVEGGDEDGTAEVPGPPSEFGGTITEVVIVLSRQAGLWSSDGMGMGEAGALQRARIYAASKLGIFNALALALRVHVDNPTFAHAALSLLIALCACPSVGVAGSGLKQEALQAVQAAGRRFVEEETVQELVDELITVMSEVYSEQSGKVFLERLNTAVQALDACEHTRFKDDDGNFYYLSSAGETVWTMPTDFAVACQALVLLHAMGRVLDESAVEAAPAHLLSAALGAVNAHAHDPFVVGVLLSALAKLADLEDNHGALVDSNVVGLCMAAARTHKDDPKIAEAVLALLQPLSFDPDHTQLLASTGCTRLIIEIGKQFGSVLTMYTGSAPGWLDTFDELAIAPRATGADADTKNAMEPRLAKVAVQTLANLACANEEETSEKGKVSSDVVGVTPTSVDVIANAGGVDLLTHLMRAHLDNPRLLEDILCALSNLAFASEHVQDTVGAICMDEIVLVARRFYADEHLMRMALRAVGNLTRADVNVLRVLGYGAVLAIHSGIEAHAAHEDILQLSADVLGNLASVDDSSVALNKARDVMQQSFEVRLDDTDGGRPADADAQIAEFTQLLESTASTKELVCSVMFFDGAPQSLLQLVEQFNVNEQLLISSLRALHYMGGSDDLVMRMVEDMRIVPLVVLAMRSCDYSAELLRRGVRVLGQVMSVDPGHESIVRAGVPQVLLSAIDTHHHTKAGTASMDAVAAAVGLCSTCYAVLHELPAENVYGPVAELDAISTALAVLSAHSDNPQYSAIVLSVLDVWCDAPDIDTGLLSRSLPVVLHVAMANPNDVFLLAAALQFCAKVSRHEECLPAVMDCGVLPAACAVLGSIFGDDPAAETPSKCRPVTLQGLQVICNVLDGGMSPALEPEVPAVKAALETARDVHAKLRSNGEEFYDKEMVSRAEEGLRKLAVLMMPVSGMAGAKAAAAGSRAGAKKARAAGSASTTGGSSANPLRGKSARGSSAAKSTKPARASSASAAGTAQKKPEPTTPGEIMAKLRLDLNAAERALFTSMCTAEGLNALLWSSQSDSSYVVIRFLMSSRTVVIAPAAEAESGTVQPDIGVSLRGSRLSHIHTGNPPTSKKSGMFKKGPKEARCLAVLAGDESVVAHLQLDDMEMRNGMVRIFEQLSVATL